MPALLQRPDQRGLGEARRRLGEVLLARQADQVQRLAVLQVGQDGQALVLLVVLALDVEGLVAVEDPLPRAGVQGVSVRADVDPHLVEPRRCHLRGEGSLPDEVVEPQLVRLEVARQRLRRPGEAGGADRLVRLLGAARLRAVGVRALRHELGAVALAHHLARLPDRTGGHGHRVGAHVGDQADLALRQRDAFVQRLRHAHGATGTEAQLARRLLLQRAGGEGRRRVLLLLAARDLADREGGASQRLLVLTRLLLGADARLLSVDAGQLRGEARLAAGTAQLREQRPVLLRYEGVDLALAVDDQPYRHALHPPGREAAADLAADQRAELVADQPIDDAACLLRVHQVQVDAARIGEGLVDGALGDLAEGHAADLVSAQAGVLGDVPGDRLTLAIEVGGQPDQVGASRLVGQLVQLLAPILQRHVAGLEVVVHVHAQAARRQVADMAVGGQHGIPGAQVALDCLGLGGRLDDHEIARTSLLRGHTVRECSTGSAASRGIAEAPRTCVRAPRQAAESGRMSPGRRFAIRRSPRPR